MDIAILGAGSVGGNLGRGWTKAEHRITFGVRDPSAAKVTALVSEVGNGARAAGVAEAAATAGVVVLATPWPVTEEVLAATGGLAGKVLVDCTNPIDPATFSLAVGFDTSAAERIAAWAPDARVVKAFNTIGAEHFLDPSFEARKASMFVCGDDAEAKELVLGLAADLGFAPEDAGPLVNARLLEPLAMVWIEIAVKQHRGRNIAFRLLRK
ncbi:MAG: NADPH-dependent F420 reductase [Planctomycetota bacterium]|jgi:NADPH-dependent F420 reductase